MKFIKVAANVESEANLRLQFNSTDVSNLFVNFARVSEFDRSTFFVHLPEFAFLSFQTYNNPNSVNLLVLFGTFCHIVALLAWCSLAVLR